MNVVIAHPVGLCRETRSMLEQLGCEVLEASSVEETLAVCRRASPDVLVLDVGIHGPIPGGHIVEKLRSDPRAAGIRIVALAAELDVDQALEGLRAAVEEYVLERARAAEVAVRLETADLVRALEERVEQQASDLQGLVHTDLLTGLLNRRFLEQQLTAQICGARRHCRALSLLVLDIDCFKQINDTHGHQAGDAALQHVGQALRQRLRDEDIVGRWGGDEFVALLPYADARGAAAAGEALRQAIADQPLVSADTEHQLSVSLGAATWRGEDGRELFARADAALYEAKRRGRGRLHADAGSPRLPAPATAPPASAKTAATVRAVIVDDVAEIRELVRLGLKDSDVEVVGEAGDGREALALIESVKPDVAVLDMHMPHMDGFRCARELARLHPDVTTIAYTSTDDPRVIDALLAAGVIRHFAKAQLNDLLAFLNSPELGEAIVGRRRNLANGR